MINALAAALAVAATVTALEWRLLARASAATRWLFGLFLVLSVGLYVYQAQNTHVWRPGEVLDLFAPASGRP